MTGSRDLEDVSQVAAADVERGLASPRDDSKQSDLSLSNEAFDVINTVSALLAGFSVSHLLGLGENFANKASRPSCKVFLYCLVTSALVNLAVSLILVTCRFFCEMIALRVNDDAVNFIRQIHAVRSATVWAFILSVPVFFAGILAHLECTFDSPLDRTLVYVFGAVCLCASNALLYVFSRWLELQPGFATCAQWLRCYVELPLRCLMLVLAPCMCVKCCLRCYFCCCFGFCDGERRMEEAREALPLFLRVMVDKPAQPRPQPTQAAARRGHDRPT